MHKPRKSETMNKSTTFAITCFILALILLISFIDLKFFEKSTQDDTRSQRRLQTEQQMQKYQMPNRWDLPKDILERRYKECDGKTVTKTGGFCLTATDVLGGNNIVDRRLADYLAENVFAGKTVIDLGAGLGHYGKIFQEEGSKVAGWEGYDGAMNVEKATNGLVKFMDLTQPDAADQRLCSAGDYVLSLEVGEHIPKEHQENYLRNIRCHAREGAVISWANQGGYAHVNKLPLETVKALMDKWGFEVDEELTRGAKEASTRWYFTNNVVVYKLKTTM